MEQTETPPRLGAGAYRDAFLEGLQPPPDLSVSDWADRHRIISGRYAAEPGPWSTDRTPYLREIMDSLGPSCRARRVSFMKGSQVGATEGPGCNWVGYVIDHRPGPMLVVQPSLGDAQKFSQQRLDTMIEDAEVLRRKVSEKKSRESGNTTLLKTFAGGILVLSGCLSARSLRSMPVRDIFMDEVDDYPQDLDGEGDPVMLAERGQRTFFRRKTLLASTPTIDGRSRIQNEFEDSDQSYYLVPCPHCDHRQRLEWGDGESHGLRWDGDDVNEAPATARYICAGCKGEIFEHQKTAMLAAGTWVAKYPERSGRHRGFHLSALYSPLGWFSWADAVEQFLKSKGNPDKLRVFVNQTLGEVWKEQGDLPDWKELYRRRREDLEIGIVAPGGLVLTAGVDVQADRLEILVRAWGFELESWVVDYVVLPGKPTEAEVWKNLDRVLNHTYSRADKGPDMRIRSMAIDCAYQGTPVYAYQRRHAAGGRVFAVRGRDDFPMLVGGLRSVDFNRKGKRIRRGAKFWPLGVGEAKRELFGWLNQEPPLNPSEDGFPPGWVHFPMMPQEFFEQLCSEQLVRRRIRGKARYIWEPIRERNEVLDCSVYSRAAAAIVGLDRWKKKDWDSAREALGGETPKAKPKPRKKEGGLFDRHRP